MVKLRLRQIFKQKHVTQAVIAKRLGVSTMTVSGWTTGRHFPTIETLDRISEMLDVPITEFFDTAPRGEITLQLNVGDRFITITPEMLRNVSDTTTDPPKRRRRSKAQKPARPKEQQ